MSMTPQEIDQLAACRMHVAELHGWLKWALSELDQPTNPLPSLEQAREALNRSEPEMLDIIENARAVVAARSGPLSLNDLLDAVDSLAAALPKAST